jgi:hypothetical protein
MTKEKERNMTKARSACRGPKRKARSARTALMEELGLKETGRPGERT